MATQTNTDISNERLIRLNDVPKLAWLPRRRGGARLNVSTLWRWSMRGVGGRRLRVVRCGGALATNQTWLREFFENLAPQPTPSQPQVRSPSARDRDVAAAQAKLAKEGIS
jgi:hypothetical protein